MHPLYTALERIEDLEIRRKVISAYVGSHDVSKFLPKDGRLLVQERVPYIDGEISFPFVVGHKYLRDEPYSRDESPAFVIGLVETSSGIELLVVEPGEGDKSIGCLPRDWMLPPQIMIQRRYESMIQRRRESMTQRR